MQIDLVRHGPWAGQVDNVLHPARQPVFGFDDDDDDLGDAKRGNGEVVRAQAKADLADDPSRNPGHQRADGPCDQRGQAKAADIAIGGGVISLNRGDAAVKDRAIEEKADDEERGHGKATGAARLHGAVKHCGRDDHANPDRQTA